MFTARRFVVLALSGYAIGRIIEVAYKISQRVQWHDNFLQVDMRQYPHIAITFSHHYLREMYMRAVNMELLDTALDDHEKMAFDILREEYDHITPSEKLIYSWLYERFRLTGLQPELQR